jgi:ATP synthase protein I
MSGERADYRVLAMAGTAVAELVAPVLIGIWVDNRYGSAPWGLAVGAVVGFVGGLVHLMVVASKSDGSEKSDGANEDGRSGPPV